jgi:Domain of unknown function (DUF4112)
VTSTENRILRYRGDAKSERLARLDALAALLDSAIVIPGINVRIGLDALVGLFPVLGDVITSAISLFIVYEARQLGAPRHLIARMLGNVLIDGAVGALPLVGDAFDVMWRSFEICVSSTPGSSAKASGK